MKPPLPSRALQDEQMSAFMLAIANAYVSCAELRLKNPLCVSLRDKTNLMSCLSVQMAMNTAISDVNALCPAPYCRWAVNTVINDVNAFLDHIVASTNMRCLTPPSALTGNCGFLAANLYAKSVFGEDALVNVSVEKTPDGKLAGYIRIRCVWTCVRTIPNIVQLASPSGTT